MAVLLSLLITLNAGGTATAPKAATPTAQAVPSDNTKSRAKALLLSTGATAVPIGAGVWLGGIGDFLPTALIVGGVVGGPSAGYFYVGNYRRAWLGIALRTTGISAIVVGAKHFDIFGGGDMELRILAAGYLILYGFLVTVSSIGVDLAGWASGAEMRDHETPRLSVRPAVDPTQQATGLALHVRF